MNVTDILITSLTVWSIWFEEHIGSILFIIIIMAVTIATARLLDRLLEKYFIKVALKIKVDPTEYRLLRHFIVFSIYTIGIIIIIFSIPQLHSLSVALLASAGVAGIIIGLAAQTTIGNIISGVSLAVSHPFRVGDLVTIHNEYGTISDLTLRHTVMTTWDNRRLIIPNLIVNDLDIINWSIEDPIIIWPIDIAISYDSDIDLARSIMISESVKHPMV
ncbi:MAG: mechanosensitive ion channel family protein, partial [Candidatus Methanomarinus sp.]